MKPCLPALASIGFCCSQSNNLTKVTILGTPVLTTEGYPFLETPAPLHPLLALQLEKCQLLHAVGIFSSGSVLTSGSVYKHV